MEIRRMRYGDYQEVYRLWLACSGMGLNNLDDSPAGVATRLVAQALEALEQMGIHKAALVVFERNESGNKLWKKLGFTVREDLVYRNKPLAEMSKINT